MFILDQDFSADIHTLELVDHTIRSDVDAILKLHVPSC